MNLDPKKVGMWAVLVILIILFWSGIYIIVAGIRTANAQASTRLHRTYATCYNLHGTMFDGTQTRARSAASNMHRMGTRIRLVGRPFFGGYRRFVIRDTGPALSDGHIDIWYMGFSCVAWGHRPIAYKLGWGRP